MSYYLNVDNIDNAWEVLMAELYSQKEDYCLDSRDGVVVGELLNACITIKDPTRCILKSRKRKMPTRYAIGELLWYLSGSNKVDDIGVYSKVWKNLTDNGETVNSAYGYRIFEKYGFDQMDYVYKVLKEHPDSRQAVIHIKDAINYLDYPTKDVPCTIALQYFIRDGKLHTTTYMRSNDIWTGFPYDVFSFTAFQTMLAFKLNVGIGEYTHIAGSLHLYERDAISYTKNLEEITNNESEKATVKSD